MSWVAAAVAGSSLIGGAMGQQQAQAGRDSADAARREAMAQFAGMELPDSEKQRLVLEMLQNAGQYNPESEQTFGMDPTAMEQIALDPRLQQNQMSALEQIAQISQTGMSDADRASLELIRRQAASEDQAKQEQILQQMQARGQGGSGAELIAKLKSSQSSADRMNQQALEEAKMQQQARMAALGQQASMAGTIRQQDYGQQADIAKARDTINQFNTANRQSVASRNVNSANNASLQNLQNQQRISDSNTGLRNQEQIHNKNLQQQDYDNRMRLAAARSGQYQNQASSADASAAQQAAMWSGIGQGVGTGIATYAGTKK